MFSRRMLYHQRKRLHKNAAEWLREMQGYSDVDKKYESCVTQQVYRHLKFCGNQEAAREVHINLNSIDANSKLGRWSSLLGYPSLFLLSFDFLSSSVVQFLTLLLFITDTYGKKSFFEIRTRERLHEYINKWNFESACTIFFNCVLCVCFYFKILSMQTWNLRGRLLAGLSQSFFFFFFFFFSFPILHTFIHCS